MVRERNPDPTDKYLPDEATVEAAMKGPTEFPSKADPKVLAQLRQQLAENRFSSNPDILRPAPPSEPVYAVAEVRGVSPDATTRVEPKVQLALPPAPSETPTQPSLKRFEGEPDVPGVVKGPSRARAGEAGEGTALRGLRGVSPRTAAVAVLAVLVPVLIVIALMGREIRKAERAGAASASTATESSATQSMPLPATRTAAPSAPEAVPSPPPVASVDPSGAPPTAAVSAAVPSPKGTPVKAKQRGTSDRAHDPVPPVPALTAAPSAQPSAAPTADKVTVPPYVEEQPGY